MIPNMVVLAPKDGDELKQMLSWSVTQNKSISIRYPRGEVPAENGQLTTPLKLGACEDLSPSVTENIDILILAVGNFVWPSVKLAEEISAEDSKNVKVINLRFLKPLDLSTLKPLIAKAKLVCVIEDGSQIGGAYHYIINQCNDLDKPLSEWLSFAIPDRFIDHGSVSQLQNEINLLPNQIKETIKLKSKELLHT